MSSIEVYADSISTRYEQHGQALAQAQQKADQILGSLDYAAHSAASFQRSISSSFGMRTWLPYIYCPLISVVMGSYGLHPSLARNVVLAGAGEVVGFVVSYLSNVSWDGFYINSGPDNVGSTAINSTSVA